MRLSKHEYRLIYPIFLLLVFFLLLSGCAGKQQASLNNHNGLINVRLEGASDYLVAEIFGKAILTVPGVKKAKRYRSQVVSNNPQGSHILWSAETFGITPFELESEIMKSIDELLDVGGEVIINDVNFS